MVTTHPQSVVDFGNIDVTPLGNQSDITGTVGSRCHVRQPAASCQSPTVTTTRIEVCAAWSGGLAWCERGKPDLTTATVEPSFCWWVPGFARTGGITESLAASYRANPVVTTESPVLAASTRSTWLFGHLSSGFARTLSCACETPAFGRRKAPNL